MVIMIKVGIYVILCLMLLIFGLDVGEFVGFGVLVLMIGGVLIMGFGMIGIMGLLELVCKGGYLVIILLGMVLVVVGFV